MINYFRENKTKSRKVGVLKNNTIVVLIIDTNSY